jgi:hypothetical protein
LRAAFAVFYLERNPGDTHGLQKLLGHRNPATTEIYLRKLDTETSMERVRGLSWGVADNDVSSSSPVVGAGGFEPPWPDSPVAEPPGSQRLLLDLLGAARSASGETTLDGRPPAVTGEDPTTTERAEASSDGR